MSLASTASPWINDDPNKKKTPTMNRKTIKTRNTPSGSSVEDDYMIFNAIEVQQQTDDRTNKVTEIINQMSAVSVENDGSKLADFTPPPNPEVQQKKPVESNLAVPLQMPPAKDKVTAYMNAPPLGNYAQAYVPPPTISPFMTNAGVEGLRSSPTSSSSLIKPYYSNMGIGSGDKMIEKINYMIHMLENMESEKTANVTEEFVLYTFTGIFIIFVLDTFLKTGKYVR